MKPLAVSPQKQKPVADIGGLAMTILVQTVEMVLEALPLGCVFGVEVGVCIVDAID